MKPLLLTASLCLAAFTTQAQVSPLVQLIVIGTSPALRNNLINNVTADAPYVPQATRRLQLQRTPVGKLPKKNGEAIVELEAQLQRYYIIYTTDSLVEIIGPEQYKAFGDGRRKVQTAPYSWNIRPYDEEMAFYQQQDHLRRARRERLTRLPQPQAPLDSLR